MNNVDALKALYAALGGEPADVANASAIVEVLNAIAAKYEGEDDATLNAEAIANITAVIDNIVPEPEQAAYEAIAYKASDTSSSKVIICLYNSINSDGEFNVQFQANTGVDATIGNTAILSSPAKKINVTAGVLDGTICFTPSSDFDGIYSGGTKLTTTGDTVTPGDGNMYIFTYSGMQSTYSIVKRGSQFVIPVENE